MYLKAVTTFDKEKQYIAKSLLKLHIATPDAEVEKYLKKFYAKTSLATIKSYYRMI
jgi:hypothetical protein